MKTEYRYITPLDVLILRGNQSFGDPGSFGDSQMPPWPSVAAGAIRSRMLVDKDVDINAFARGRVDDSELGTPDKPGSFVLTGFYLARLQQGQPEILIAPPADLIISETVAGVPEVRQLRPQQLHPELTSSCPLPMLPVMAQSERTKPASGYWLSQRGWQAYLTGKLPASEHLVRTEDLWCSDLRVGIGMSTETLSVEDGKLFTTQAIAMKKDVGFLVAVQGAVPPTDGLLRFGGDGRAADIQAINANLPEPDYQHIAQSGRCKMVLTTPGLFENGWQLPGTTDPNKIQLPQGITARLIAAAVSRAEILSGWDLARQQPKPAQRIAPTGSVYWLDELQATPEALRKLAEKGLWSNPCEDKYRKAEGFNRVALSPWQ